MSKLAASVDGAPLVVPFQEHLHVEWQEWQAMVLRCYCHRTGKRSRENRLRSITCARPSALRSSSDFPPYFWQSSG